MGRQPCHPVTGPPIELVPAGTAWHGHRTMAARTDLIVALDVPQTDALPALLARLPRTVHWFKLGLELFCAEGPQALTAIWF